ncbi:hypothetical protein EDC30_10863 [Paucimonas lemoignei]|uniref:Uncharacterized protein n=1 Tax=Paucimonas lemoignei TaxID=29443 RepID=A0A4V2UIF9_PAULE|nr:hypothetical protein [Paucimonas lemoignei]TCS36000.1 hypothetical protein EDC30_10863 [Paucimonas lemoignei]
MSSRISLSLCPIPGTLFRPVSVFFYNHTLVWQLHRAPIPEEDPLDPLPGEEPSPDEEELPPHPNPSIVNAAPELSKTISTSGAARCSRLRQTFH